MRASATALEQRTLAALDKVDLSADGRVTVYPYGAAEAMLIAACDPGWRRRYPAVLGLTPLIERAAASCNRNGKARSIRL